MPLVVAVDVPDVIVTALLPVAVPVARAFDPDFVLTVRPQLARKPEGRVNPEGVVSRK